MSREDAIAALERLEAISASFDYEQAKTYVNLFREYLRKVSQFLAATDQPRTPIVDTVGELDSPLPADLHQRLEAWLDHRSDFAPTSKDVCRWYVNFQWAQDQLPADRRQIAAVYEPLIKIFCAGGDFYLHHGWICFRDAASMPLANFYSAGRTESD